MKKLTKKHFTLYIYLNQLKNAISLEPICFPEMGFRQDDRNRVVPDPAQCIDSLNELRGCFISHIQGSPRNQRKIKVNYTHFSKTESLYRNAFRASMTSLKLFFLHSVTSVLAPHFYGYICAELFKFFSDTAHISQSVQGFIRLQISLVNSLIFHFSDIIQPHFSDYHLSLSPEIHTQLDWAKLMGAAGRHLQEERTFIEP